MNSPETSPGYAELHCISNYSFLRGASHPEELVAQAAKLGYGALAITDECSMSGVVKAHVAAEHFKLKLIVGSEFTFEEGFKLVLLAPDRSAYGQLCNLISIGRRRSPKGEYAVSRSTFTLSHTTAKHTYSPHCHPTHTFTHTNYSLFSN